MRRDARAVGRPRRGADGGGAPDVRKNGIGHLLLEQLLATAREVGVERVFVPDVRGPVLRRPRFPEIEGTPVPHHVYAELLRSYDEGVAEFLDLERVKPNTLGNTRMLRMLT